MALDGLDEAGVLGLVEAAWGHSLDEAGMDLAASLCHETDGNPFFVSEMLRHLSETGALYANDQGHLVTTEAFSEMALPHSVRQVISARVARLGDQALSVLRLAAVIGRTFDLDVLAHASGIDEEDLLDLLEEAQGASVLCEVQEVAGRYRFAHALIAHTLATDMGPTRRARAHRTVAGALEALWEGELGPDALDDQVLVGLERTASAKKAGRLRQLAHHYALTAQAADHPRALAYCRLAGHAALGALAPDEATGWFAKALELYHADGPTDQALGTDLLIGLGTAQRHAGDPDHRRHPAGGLSPGPGPRRGPGFDPSCAHRL